MVLADSHMFQVNISMDTLSSGDGQLERPQLSVGDDNGSADSWSNTNFPLNQDKAHVLQTLFS